MNKLVKLGVHKLHKELETKHKFANKRPEGITKLNKKNLQGYIGSEDIFKLQRLNLNIFQDYGPIKKNQFYFIGETGDNETKYMNH